MALEVLAEGGRGSLLGIDTYEERFAEGQRGELRINMLSIPPGTRSALQFALRGAGVPLEGDVRQEGGFFGGSLFIPFRKTLPVLILVAGVIAVFFVGAILLLVTSWALFREPPIGALFPDNPFGQLAIVAALALVVFAFTGQRRRRRTT